MLVSIHQPEFLPWLPFFDKLDRADLFLLLDTAQFSKNYFHNRAKIRGEGESWQWLTVPVQKGPLSTSIASKKLVGGDKWRKKLLKTVEQCYRKAPYFDTHFPPIAELLLGPTDLLGELNCSLIEYCARALDIKTPQQRCSALPLSGDLHGSELILALCEKAGATVYLSGRFGKNYLAEEEFARKGIRILYQNYDFPHYPQPRGEFVPGMSIVDLLFNCGPHSLSTLRQGRNY